MNDEDDDANRKHKWIWFLILVLFLTSCNNTAKETTDGNNQYPASPFDKQPLPARVPYTATSIDSSKFTVYLTFDDGPNAGTSTVKHILDQEGVPGSFFIVGLHALNASPHQKIILDSLRKSEQYVVANHSLTHAYRNHFHAYYTDPSGVVLDFKKAKDTLHLNNNLGRGPGSNFWRLPGVHANYTALTTPAADSLQNAGFEIMGWDWEWMFRKGTLLVQSADQMYQEIDSFLVHRETRIPKHFVLLTHDLTFKDEKDSASLVQLIHLLKQNRNMQFALITQYPGLHKKND